MIEIVFLWRLMQIALIWGCAGALFNSRAGYCPQTGSEEVQDVVTGDIAGGGWDEITRVRFLWAIQFPLDPCCGPPHKGFLSRRILAGHLVPPPASVWPAHTQSFLPRGMSHVP